MSDRKERKITIKPLFLLGSRPLFLQDDRSKFYSITDTHAYDVKTDELLHRLGIETEPKILIKNDDDLQYLDITADVFIVFAHCIRRFPSLIMLANTGKPIIITGDEGALGEVLDTYQYLAEYQNVKYAATCDDVRKQVEVLDAVMHILESKVCLFDTGERTLDGVVWYKNPLLKGQIKTHYVDVNDFETRYKSINNTDAETLAKSWVAESEVVEVLLTDVAKSACLYLAMKNIIEDVQADVAYVLWCAQFEPMLGTKMCFAIAKLNDDGYLTGCWRGENLLPMIIMRRLTKKPIFFGEIHTYRDGIIMLRHCAVTKKIAHRPYVLKPWRDRQGTVTGYVELPQGQVTIVSCGQGDRMVAIRGRVLETRDLGGENCRTTVWVRIDNADLIQHIPSRECTMVYGNYVKETQEAGKRLGIKTIG
jgi:hypothetical protein